MPRRQMPHGVADDLRMGQRRAVLLDRPGLGRLWRYIQPAQSFLPKN
jgi:hypothetical protein